jgi:oligosaccharide repeat unit polymerase
LLAEALKGMEALPESLLAVLLVLAALAPGLLRFGGMLARPSAAGALPRLDFFSPWVAFPLLYALVYGLGALELASWEEVIPREDFSLYFLGLLAYFLGVLVSRPLVRARTDAPAPVAAAGSELLLIILLFGVTFLVAVMVFAKAGNPLFAPDFENARTRVVIEVGGWAYYLYRTIAVALIILLAAWYRTDAEGRFTVALLIGVAVFLILSGGYRSHLLVPLVTVVVFRHYFYRPIPPAALLAIAGATLGFLVGFGAFRMVGAGEELGAEFGRKLFVEIQNPAFALARIQEYFPWTYDHFNGLYLLRGFLALLPGEQVAIGLILKEMLGLHYAGGGFAPSILGGFYIDFGVRGVFFGMMACGVVLGWAYRRMIASRKFYDTLIYAYLLAYLAFCIRGGVLQEIFPLWVLILLVGFRVIFRGGRMGVSGREGHEAA